MVKADIIAGCCGWCAGDKDYIAYHDNEWGRLKTDENGLFEKIVLEGAQAGLNWLTILKRRDGYRKAFHQFTPEKVATMTEKDVEQLMLNPGIIRNRLKIKSAITNAVAFLKVQEEFDSFLNYIKSFLPNGTPIVNHFKSLSEIPASTELSDKISRDMKRRGFKFFGTTMCYAFLQSCGFVNDHLVGCKCRKTN